MAADPSKIPVPGFFRQSKSRSATISSKVETSAGAPVSGPVKDPSSAAALKSLLATSSLPDSQDYHRIWQPDESLSSEPETTSTTVRFDPERASFSSRISSAETSSLSASTASSIPSLSLEGKVEQEASVPLPSQSTPNVRNKAPDSSILSERTRAIGMSLRSVGYSKRRTSSPINNRNTLTDPLGNDVPDRSLGTMGSTIKLNDRYPPTSLPPALREITAEELKMTLVSESSLLDESPTTFDRDEPVLDRFGFQMLETASQYGLRTFQYRKHQQRKVDLWTQFRRQCQEDRRIESPMEDMPFGTAGWGNLGDVGRNLQTRFNYLVGQGIPVDLRAEVWKEAIGSRLVMSACDYDSYLYQAERELPADVIRDIEFDVGRTLTQSNVFFYDGKGPGSDRLRSVLRAYAIRNPDTGYCQGMNKIAAYVILTVADAPTVFHIFSAIIDTVMPPRYWTDSMNLASADQHVLKSLLSREIPDVYLHLQKLNSFVVPFTLRWFVSLFTDGLYNTSAEFVYRVWDMILTRPFPDGYNYLLAVSIAIFCENKELILAARTTMEVHDVIAHRLGVPDDRITAVLRRANEMQFPIRVIDNLRERARAQLEHGDANAEGDIPGCVSSRVLNGNKSSGRFPSLSGYGRLSRGRSE